MVVSHFSFHHNFCNNSKFISFVPPWAFPHSSFVVCVEASVHVAPQRGPALRGYPQPPQRGGGGAGDGDAAAGGGFASRSKYAAHRSRRGKNFSFVGESRLRGSFSCAFLLRLEVYLLGEGEDSKGWLASSGHTVEQLFLSHVTKVAKAIKETWPHLTIIMWDDMMRSMSQETLKGEERIQIDLPIPDT